LPLVKGELPCDDRRRTPNGSASMLGVTINSAAFGAKNVMFSGTAPANKVIFKTLDGSVVIYANRRTITGNIQIATSIAK
jgi:hypothetical protein